MMRRGRPGRPLFHAAVDLFYQEPGDRRLLAEVPVGQVLHLVVEESSFRQRPVELVAVHRLTPRRLFLARPRAKNFTQVV